MSLATEMVNAVSDPYADMESFFGVSGGAVDVIIAPLSGNNDGTGGAYHYGCDFTTGGVLYLDATFASTAVDPLSLEVALYVAELVNRHGPEGGGWGCGFSNGEGLSRFCAEQETSLATLSAYAAGQASAQAGFPDWVTQTERTDRMPCRPVHYRLHLLMRSLGYTKSQIIQAAGTTLSANYRA